MKFLEIVRFEIVHQLRSRSTWICFALFLFPLIGTTNGMAIDARSGETTFFAPLSIAQSCVMMSVLALLLIAVLASEAALRDVHTRQEPLMHATPVGRVSYLGGRFLGAFAVGASLLAAVPLAFLLAPLFHPDLDAKLVGPFRPAAFLQPYFLLILPNVFVVTSILFAMAVLVRHTLASYIGAALLFAGTLLNMEFVANEFGQWGVAKLLDPMGVTLLSAMARTWSPIELSERLIASDETLLWNRLLWLALAFAALAFTVVRFRFGDNPRRARWWRRRGSRAGVLDGASSDGRLQAAAFARNAAVIVPRARRDFGVAGRVRQTLAIARDSLREMVTGWSWLVLPFLVLQIAVNVEALSAMGAGGPVVPTTSRVLETFADVLNTVLIFAVLFAGELVWRERDANVQALADAAPVRDGVRFVGKLLGLWLVIVALHGLLMLAGVITQLSFGWHDFELAVYVQILLGLELVDSLVFALLALSVHVLVNQKHVGHLAMLFFVLAPGTLTSALGIEHPLLLLGSEPSWRHSPISGFSPFLPAVLSFEAYWAAWTVVVALVARLAWVRGVEPRIGERVRSVRRRFTRRMAAVATLVFAPALLAGGFILYNTNVLNEYRSSAELRRRRAEYERKYGDSRGVPQPQLTATQLHVDIDPDRRVVDIRGVHRVRNKTTQPIDTLHVAVSSDVTTSEIEFERPARATLVDDDLGHRTYRLEEPLAPDDTLRWSWQVHYEPRGFPAGPIDTAVVENGSFFVVNDWIPLVGYQDRRELSDDADRKEHGLAARPTLPSLDDVDARSDPAGHERIDLEVTIGTAVDQIAIAPGRLRSTSTRDGRRYFEYATDAPIGPGYAVFSARYAVREARCGDVAIEVVHHPAHDRNVERMVRGMTASLEQFSERFGPYPHKVLRMVEYSAVGGSLHAAATTIWYRELFSLFDPESDERRFDLPFAVVAHEVAHQWWGGQLSYARVEGAPLLSESLAWYSAIGVIEREHGTEHLQRFLAFMRDAYLDPRSRADVPLLRASDWFLAYRKGPFAMYALREYVGQEQVDIALRRLLAQHASYEPPFPISLDLHRKLQEVTPDSLQYLLHDLFEANTFWELETKRATVEQHDAGVWRVELDVHARKVVVDEKGVETDVPMSDLVEIGVFARAGPDEMRGKPLHLAMHSIHTGQQTIAITVSERPELAGLDPRHLLIDAEPRDNVVDVQDDALSKN